MRSKFQLISNTTKDFDVCLFKPLCDNFQSCISVKTSCCESKCLRHTVYRCVYLEKEEVMYYRLVSS